MHVVRLCVLIATAALSGRALAQGAPPLSVTRGAGADDCPDAAGLIASIEEIRKSPARPDQPPYRATFARDEHGIYAQLVNEQTGADRVLTDTSPDCAALAKAAAVTLALLFDADAHALEQAPPKEPPPAPVPQPIEREPEAPPEATAATGDPEGHRFVLGYGIGALAGVIAPVGGLLSFEAGYAYGPWRGGLGLAYGFAAAHALGSGSVTQSINAASFVACFAPWRDHLWRVELCAALLTGTVSANADGFADNRESSRGWLAPALDLRFGRLPDWLGGELSAALLLPTTRRDFAIEGAGIAYESAPIALQLTLRMLLSPGSFGD